MYQKRSYRNIACVNNLVSFQVAVKETDLFIHSAENLEHIARELILRYRGYIETYIKKHPEFEKTLQPLKVNEPVPNIISDMTQAGEKAGVGPMASVAGAVAEHVGIGLLEHADEVIVENGGDLFIKTENPVTVGIFAGKSPLSMHIGLQVDPDGKQIAICTSSGSVGHSFSLGKADAVCVVSGSCSLADAAATSIGNHVMKKTDIQKAIDFGKTIDGVKGIVVIADDNIGMWGDVKIVALKGKKG
ncbi:MAG: UPF0280 family protein [Deltaproteobacteria bacterium]|nr:UPF0280 family protein [Deltaproteobacteria bacterium]MBW2564621.1 UPF0280 family protein [Deltaproteobacteria bacterium]